MEIPKQRSIRISSQPELVFLQESRTSKCFGIQMSISGVAQWKRAGLITQRSVDRNHSPLKTFFCFNSINKFYFCRRFYSIFEPSFLNYCLFISNNQPQVTIIFRLSLIFQKLLPSFHEKKT